MYSIGAILSKEPVAIASALRSILFIGVLAGLFVMDEQLLASIALGAEVLLSLFVRNATTPTVTAEHTEARAYADGAKDQAETQNIYPPTPYGEAP